MKHLYVILVASLLLGCATPAEHPEGARIKKGAQVSAPYGYEELCKREPEVPECGGKR